MKKRKIFDIEKVGFGDEIKVSPTPKPISKKEVPVMIQPVESSIAKPIVNRPQAVLSPEVNVRKERQNSTVASSNSSRLNTSSTMTGYRPVEFVSPISGRRVTQPKRVHLAHGQYELSTASLVDELNDESLHEDAQIQLPLSDEVTEGVTDLNEELDQMFEIEEKSQTCPSSTIENDVTELEVNETTSDRSVSDQTQDIILKQELDVNEKLDLKIAVEGATSEKRDGLLSEIVSEVKELAVTIVETINKSQEVSETDDHEDKREALEPSQDIESMITSNQNHPILLQEANQIIEKAQTVSLKEEPLVVNQMDEKQSVEEEINHHSERLETSLNKTSNHNVTESVSNQEECPKKDQELVQDHSHCTIQMNNSSELEVDDVLAILDEEEKIPSIFDKILAEENQTKNNEQSLAIDDVLTLLEEEETTPSIFDQLLSEHQEEVVLSDDVLNQTQDDDLDEALDESFDLFDDDNFCNEVLEQIQVEEEENQVIYYETPDFALLKEPRHSEINDEEWIVSKMEILEQTFADFGVKVRLTGDYTQGPTVTQIEIQPESGTKLNKIIGLSDDLKLSLSVEELRIEPIPGKNTIGVEIPNPTRKMVYLKEILSRPDFILHESPLYIGLGQDVSGQPVYADISTMPHGLIAGQTGSGKSVCINTLLVSLLYKASPEDVRLMLVDPKRVELAPYNAIPHLITPVICDERKAAQGLKWAVDEMERRYELFATNGVRDIKSFNERRHEFEFTYEKLPYILIVIDELADLMMVSAQEVEDCIMRITQKARAAGIHLIVATQRPTVDVITGTIKSNIPSRIAFAVAQANDSRVILDETGAQNLLGQGDMLWSSSGSKVKRIQGAYISSEEIDAVVDFVKKQGKPKYLISDEVFQRGNSSVQTDTDPLLYDAMNFIFDRGHATVSSLQTRLRIGFNRAARMIDTLEMNGWISEPQGAQKQREILISREDFEAMKDMTRF
ncbi:MAG: DNA translocase FtsK [Turicibacter sp.]|nr:DNA translocase FtsK [Turicibacter sp.]